jgi:hypothetical protein
VSLLIRREVARGEPASAARYEVIVNVDKYPGDLLVKEFGPRMVCTKCGMVGADVRPNWKERSR